MDLKSRRAPGWLTRRDTPGFWRRAAAICGHLISPDTPT
ncbi:hypothetical protein ATKI12_4560 [Kitasatospora sp. Ki12]